MRAYLAAALSGRDHTAAISFVADRPLAASDVVGDDCMTSVVGVAGPDRGPTREA